MQRARGFGVYPHMTGFSDRIRPFRLATAWFGVWARLVLWARRPLIIGVTGSVGKTTTKEMIAAVLMDPAVEAIRGLAGKTTENANNVRGVSVSVLRLGVWGDYKGLLKGLALAPFRALGFVLGAPYPRTLVIEYGTSRPGQLRQMVDVVPPDISVVTVIGPAHLDKLGTVRGVAQEKGVLVEAAPPNGLVVLGTGHAFIEELAARSAAPVIRVDGVGAGLALGIARAIARHLEVPEPLVDAALARVGPVPGRLRPIECDGITILDDCYNANPLSMRYGLETLANSGGGRKVAILGDMAELGAERERFHREIGIVARRCADVVIAVGEAARGYGAQRWFETNAELIAALDDLIETGDVVLVKASHVARLDKVVKRLVALGTSPGEPLPASSAHGGRRRLTRRRSPPHKPDRIHPI